MSPEVTECLAKAAEARRKSEDASDKEIKDFWRQMEDRWIGLARGYEHANRTDTFLNNVAAVRSRSHTIEPAVTVPPVESPAAPAARTAFLRREGAEFLQLAEDCEEPDVARELGAIGTELLNEANRKNTPDQPVDGAKPRKA